MSNSVIKSSIQHPTSFGNKRKHPLGMLTKHCGGSTFIKVICMTGFVSGYALLSGCASTGNISPQYVAPSTYQNYNCQNLSQEYNRISNYIKLAKSQYSTFAATGVGIGVSAGRWGVSPNINIGLGKSHNTQARDSKLAKLYGERDAVVQSARMKQCTFSSTLKTFNEAKAVK